MQILMQERWSPYVVGTGVGAVGEGSRHAIFGVLGMLAVLAAAGTVVLRWHREPRTPEARP